jgi:hypothetical protein
VPVAPAIAILIELCFSRSGNRRADLAVPWLAFHGDSFHLAAAHVVAMCEVSATA